jgi:hypothetical protein
MELNTANNRELADLENKYNDRKTLWTNIEKFAKSHDEWFKSNFLSLDVEEIE